MTVLALFPVMVIRSVALAIAVVAVGVFLFTLRTWYYTGVFSIFHGTQAATLQGQLNFSRDVEREVRQHFPELVFDTVIPRNVRIGEAPSYGRPVIHHDPHSSGAEAYFELAKEVAARG